MTGCGFETNLRTDLCFPIDQVDQSRFFDRGDPLREDGLSEAIIL